MSVHEKWITLLVALPYLLTLFLMIQGLQLVDDKLTLKPIYLKCLLFFNNLFLILFFILSTGFIFEFEFLTFMAAHFLAVSIAIRAYIDKFRLK
ncbi:hypothetical protein [Agitococcus lubricus]|uniref:Uncharacterized protein n=1 Tax=Agitococcus lubricus TaxID=1077255 RepID=A0A2T5J1Q2_9GAMM|nr:hypothetical protein [Agitococcus lubricus]PTQ90366.1 hypothetical protein C8N29_103119 [Agitococcus lubricus]